MKGDAAVKRIGLMVHGKREDAMDCAARVAQFMQQAGISVQAEDDAAACLLGVMPFSQAEEKPDVILSLGGDGTLLRGMQAAVKWDIPLLGINLGRVGFLAEAEPESIEDVLRSLLDGRYTLEERALLDVRMQDQRWLALNDVVVSRGGYARLITLEALVDGDTAGRYVADGLVVATPTGSTGYSLSAGGPVVSPHVDCMVITPICAHSLQHRPCVVPGNASIRLELKADAEQHASLQVDGQSCAAMKAGDWATISKADKSIRLIRTRPAHFFQLVRDKLTEWSR